MTVLRRPWNSSWPRSRTGRSSLRVLQKANFKIIGTDSGYAEARSAEIEETIRRLDG